MNRKKFGPLPLRAARRLGRGLAAVGYGLICRIPYFHFLRGYQGKQGPITLRIWFMQKVLGFNRDAYWGVHFTSKVVQPKHILLGKNTNPGIEPGCYIQGLGKVTIGDYTKVAANVAIISANHNAERLSEHIPGEVRIGSYCWLGVNSVILPNTNLGDFTIVGAGSVVTQSFLDGYCVIAGNPAKLIRNIDPKKCVREKVSNSYVGYMRTTDFMQFRNDFLWM